MPAVSPHEETSQPAPFIPKLIPAGEEHFHLRCSSLTRRPPVWRPSFISMSMPAVVESLSPSSFVPTQCPPVRKPFHLCHSSQFRCKDPSPLSFVSISMPGSMETLPLSGETLEASGIVLTSDARGQLHNRSQRKLVRLLPRHRVSRH